MNDEQSATHQRPAAASAGAASADDEMVLIARGVLASAVYAIVNHKDAPKTVEAIRAVYLQKGQP